jgi:hypothetical protein
VSAALETARVTYEELAATLTEECGALLRGDPRGLEKTLSRLGELVRDAKAHDKILRAALAPSTVANAVAGEDEREARKALHRAAENVRLLALRNAQLLVRSRDMTRRLLSALEGAAPCLDRRA